LASIKLQSLGTIGLSLLGVWAVLQAVSQLAFYLPIVLANDSEYLGWEQLFSPVVHSILGAGLISQRIPLARYLFPGDLDAELETDAPIGEFLVALLGVWLVITAIASAAQVELALFNQFSYSTEAGLHGDRIAFLMSAEAWSQRAPHILKVVFGAVLIASGPGLTHAWLAARAAGRQR
jgi:hypothetical protein